MGLQVNGRNVAAMRYSGRDAVEARCNGSVVWPVGEPPVIDGLRFTAEEAGSTILLKMEGQKPQYGAVVPVFEYTLNGGVTWIEYQSDNAPVITLHNVGDSVYIRGDNPILTQRWQPASTYFYYYPHFTMTGKIACRGSLEYLRKKDGQVSALTDYCYYRMFADCTALSRPPELPVESLNQYCYQYLFSGCSSLVEAPDLPATELAGYCYNEMFANCSSIISAPALPATELEVGCYCAMFSNCSSLASAPELPALEAKSSCYKAMFWGCTNLTSTPELPATSLAAGCYQQMFEYCYRITESPVLPALSVPISAYNSMFHGCTRIEAAGAILATYCDHGLDGMFEGCTALVNVPPLLATHVEDYAYANMFKGCTSLVTGPEILWMFIHRTTFGMGQIHFPVVCSYLILRFTPEVGTAAHGERLIIGLKMLRRPACLYVQKICRRFSTTHTSLPAGPWKPFRR